MTIPIEAIIDIEGSMYLDASLIVHAFALSRIYRGRDVLMSLRFSPHSLYHTAALDRGKRWSVMRNPRLDSLLIISD